MVFPRKPDPAYVWELLHADTGDLFLHFDVSEGMGACPKHVSKRKRIRSILG